MRERVGREDRVVEDHRLGLAAEQADLQLVPELGRVRAELMIPQLVEPAASLIAMTQAVVGHRQERPIRGHTSAAPEPDAFLEPAGAVHRGQPRYVVGQRPRSVPQPRCTDN